MMSPFTAVVLTICFVVATAASLTSTTDGTTSVFSSSSDSGGTIVVTVCDKGAVTDHCSGNCTDYTIQRPKEQCLAGNFKWGPMSIECKVSNETMCIQGALFRSQNCSTRIGGQPISRRPAGQCEDNRYYRVIPSNNGTTASVEVYFCPMCPSKKLFSPSERPPLEWNCSLVVSGPPDTCMVNKTLDSAYALEAPFPCHTTSVDLRDATPPSNCTTFKGGKKSSASGDGEGSNAPSTVCNDCPSDRKIWGTFDANRCYMYGSSYGGVIFRCS